MKSTFLKSNRTATVIKLNRYFANQAIFAKVAAFVGDKVEEFYSMDGAELVNKVKMIANEDPTATFAIIDVDFADGLN